MANEDIIKQPDDFVEESGPPPFFSRVVGVFFSPGELFEALRHNPVWFWTLLLAGLMVTASVGVVPAEAWEQMLREQGAQTGGEVPANIGMIVRISGTVFAALGLFIWAFILSGILMLLFTFFMGGDASYKQYLSVVSHSSLIGGLGALVTTPLKIIKLDPQLTLNLGTFLPTLEDGFLLRFLTVMDLFGLWSFAIIAIGISKMDPRRTVGGTFGLLVGIWVVVALAFAYFGG